MPGSVEALDIDPLPVPYNGSIRRIRTVAAVRPRDTIRGLVVAATAIALASGAIASSAQGQPTRTERAQAEQAVEEEVLQNNPDEADRTEIRDRLVWLIDGAEDGSDITIASYHFEDEEVAEALVSAMEPDRNVRVRIIADFVDSADAAYEKVENAVASSRTSWMENCGDGYNEPDDYGGENKVTSCMGEHIMHNKFFLFEHTRGASNVVLQTSANLNSYSGTDMWNTAYIATDRWLYRKQEEYVLDLREHASPTEQDPDYYNTFQAVHAPVSNGKYKVYHSPRAGQRYGAQHVLQLPEQREV